MFNYLEIIFKQYKNVFRMMSEIVIDKDSKGLVIRKSPLPKDL